jgi:hypothetical protein
MVVLCAAGCGGGSNPETEAAPAAAAPATLPDPGSLEAKIALAESAAPATIATEATIAELDDTGKLVTLREGTNGWLCLTDMPEPGEDPACVDAPWQEWFTAFMEKRDPQISQVGVAYMLRGGAAASNEDPFATAPPSGQDWLRDGPHLMIITPNQMELASLPTDHTSGLPYVMWQGTPYAHIMVPTAN